MLNNIGQTIPKASQGLLSCQHPDGYWWFTLEANPSIDAGFIQVMHFLEDVDGEIQNGLVHRILQVQHEDGSWGLYYGAPGDLNTTIECYFSLLLAKKQKQDPALIKAREFILAKGGLTQSRVFTRIHLALFGLAPWESCPYLPLSLIYLPPWAPFNIYNFSSWARVSIVPLLVILNKRPVVRITGLDLEDLFVEPPGKRKWNFARKAAPLSMENLFAVVDKGLKYVDKVPYKPWQKMALEKAVNWIWEHIQKTHDIYPALAYAAMAFKAYGYPKDSVQLQTALKALKGFQQKYAGPELPPTPWSTVHGPRPALSSVEGSTVHQQCCISPVWDTPWALVALCEAEPKYRYDERCLRAGRWLLSKEIQNASGDWRAKNPEGPPGGWSFEFLNEYFPDTDDTIEVIAALSLLNLPEGEKRPAMERGLAWLLSMQNDDGGWGAFDKNNDLELVNKIPFADHGACLDPSTPDITGRALELLLKQKTDPKTKPVQKALGFLRKSQEPFGGWYGRWGVNYIYGTWAVLTGLSVFKENPLPKETQKACDWLTSIQNPDGGFSESPQSYVTKRYHPYSVSVPSQTAWAVMGLIAGGLAQSPAAAKGIQFLMDRCEGGLWPETHFTGTGFPGHFYIRYHGYRYYFPLLALARYQKAISA